MNKITTIGLDLAKSVFHVVGCDERGKVVHKRMLKRSQVISYFSQLPGCLIGMEACATSHYWCRELSRVGHEVKLLPPRYVKSFVQGNKNDYNDALAIAEAVVRPERRCVEVKSPEQQDIQALHRLRALSVKHRTALCNQLRGLLAEQGIVIPQGVHVLCRRIPEILEDGENGLSDLFRRLLAQGYEQLKTLEREITNCNDEIKRYCNHSDACRRLQTTPGYGPIVASVFYSWVGDGRAYGKGRDVSASIGIVPRQSSSGGKQQLLAISKRGDRYLRGLLIHGARSVLQHAQNKDDRLSRWASDVQARRGYNKAVVALANKLARIGWAILRHGGEYRAA